MSKQGKCPDCGAAPRNKYQYECFSSTSHMTRGQRCFEVQVNQLTAENARLEDENKHCSQRLMGMSDDYDVRTMEVMRLQVIVDKLPKTKDGVPIIPGMTLWDKNLMSFKVKWVSIEMGHMEPEFEGDDRPLHTNLPNGLLSMAYEDRNGRFLWWKCYSTREAAEQKDTP